jgi:hypothetical protein
MSAHDWKIRVETYRFAGQGSGSVRHSGSHCLISKGKGGVDTAFTVAYRAQYKELSDASCKPPRGLKGASATGGESHGEYRTRQLVSTCNSTAGGAVLVVEVRGSQVDKVHTKYSHICGRSSLTLEFVGASRPAASHSPGPGSGQIWAIVAPTSHVTSAHGYGTSSSHSV